MARNGLNRRKKAILLAIAELGGIATTRQIAEKLGINVNGVSQTLGVLYPHVVALDGKGGECRWELSIR